MNEPRPRRLLWSCAAAAIVLRLAWALYAHRPPAILADPALYKTFAGHIASGLGYVSLFGQPTAYYPPGYPYFLGSVQWILSSAGMPASLELVTAVIQALLGGVAAAATAHAGTRLFGARVGRIAGLLVACWPSLVLYSSTLLSESLFLACFAVFLAGEASALQSPRSRRSHAIAALALGAATLVRPQVLLAIPAAILARLLARRTVAETSRAACALAAGVVLALAPWALRNAAVMGSFVALSTNGGDNMCIGFHPGARGDFQLSPYCETGLPYYAGPEAELARNRDAGARAVQWARENLAALPALSARKLYFTYRNDTGGLAAVESYGLDPFLAPALRSALAYLSDGYYFALMLAALAGAAACVRGGWQSSLASASLWLLLMTAASAVVPLIVFGDPRFKIPAAPCYALLAALGCVTLWPRLREDEQPAPERPATRSR